MNRLIIISTPFEIMPLLTQLELPNITVGAILPGKDAENHLMITGVGTPSTMLFLSKVCAAVVYKEIVPEVTDEPNYEAALEAIKEAR